jgi:hypothetical protein
MIGGNVMQYGLLTRPRSRRLETCQRPRLESWRLCFLVIGAGGVLAYAALGLLLFEVLR